MFSATSTKDLVAHRYRRCLSNSVDAQDKAIEEEYQFYEAPDVNSPEDFVEILPPVDAHMDDLSLRLGMSGHDAARAFVKDHSDGGKIRASHIPCGKTVAAKCFGILWVIRGGSYFFAGEEFSSRVPGHVDDDAEHNATTIGWITAPPDAVESDFDLVIDIARFDGTTGKLYDQQLKRITFRQDFDGWVVIPRTFNDPDAFKVVRLGEIPALRVTMQPINMPGIVDCLPRGIIPEGEYASLLKTPWQKGLLDTRPPAPTQPSGPKFAPNSVEFSDLLRRAKDETPIPYAMFREFLTHIHGNVTVLQQLTGLFKSHDLILQAQTAGTDTTVLLKQFDDTCNELTNLLKGCENARFGCIVQALCRGLQFPNHDVKGYAFSLIKDMRAFLAADPINRQSCSIRAVANPSRAERLQSHRIELENLKREREEKEEEMRKKRQKEDEELRRRLA